MSKYKRRWEEIWQAVTHIKIQWNVPRGVSERRRLALMETKNKWDTLVSSTTEMAVYIYIFFFSDHVVKFSYFYSFIFGALFCSIKLTTETTFNIVFRTFYWRIETKLFRQMFHIFRKSLLVCLSTSVDLILNPKIYILYLLQDFRATNF